jgi:predicted metal-dependent HD superfamily phosphohydrolase
MLPLSILDELRQRYREPWRRYHTQQHIDALLRWLSVHRSLARHADELDAAIWFHDAIYEPQRHDNEARSAELAQVQLAAAGFDTAFVDRVAALVLATRSHEAAAGDDDQALLLDLDLSVLGQPAWVYDAYTQQVRLEYAHVPDQPFRAGRIQVLDHFLQRPRLFIRAELAAIWEEPAQCNLRRERGALQNEVSGR